MVSITSHWHVAHCHCNSTFRPSLHRSNQVQGRGVQPKHLQQQQNLKLEPISNTTGRFTVLRRLSSLSTQIL